LGIARLSSKGQLIIPKPACQAHGWDAGQELEVIDTEDGLLSNEVSIADTVILETEWGSSYYRT